MRCTNVNHGESDGRTRLYYKYFQEKAKWRISNGRKFS